MQVSSKAQVAVGVKVGALLGSYHIVRPFHMCSTGSKYIRRGSYTVHLAYEKAFHGPFDTVGLLRSGNLSPISIWTGVPVNLVSQDCRCCNGSKSSSTQRCGAALELELYILWAVTKEQTVSQPPADHTSIVP